MDFSDTLLIAIKGRYMAPGQKYYGIFVVVINTQGNYVDTASIVAMYSDTFQISLEEAWTEFDSEIKKAKYEGKYAHTLTMDLQDSFKKISFKDDFLNEILEPLKSDDIESLKSIFHSIIGQILRDNQLHVEIKTEIIKEEDTSFLPSSDEDNLTNKSIDQDIHNPVILNANLVVAPVDGKLVTDLQLGDQIMIKIEPNSDKANYYIDMLKLRGDNGIKECQSSVTNIEEVGDSVKIFVKIYDNVFGEIIEAEKVLVKEGTFSVPAPTKIQPDQSQTSTDENKKESSSNSNIWAIASIFLILLLIAFVYIFIAP